MLQHDLDLLKKVYNRVLSACYIGGTLIVKDNNGQIFEYILTKRDQYDEVDYLLAKLYLRHKSEQHSYYKLADDIVTVIDYKLV